MAQPLKIDNFASDNVLEDTQLTADALTGATSLQVQNSQDFASTHMIVVGILGGESSEKANISSIADATHIVVPAIARDHRAFNPVTRVFGDRIKVYRAPNVNGMAPADVSFIVLTTLNIEFDQPSTLFNDAAGSNSYWYKRTYYNSVALTETDLAKSVAVRGGEYGNYTTLDAIRAEAGFRNARYITDMMIEEKRQAAQSEFNSALSGIYTLPLPTPTAPFISDIINRLAAGLLIGSQYGENNEDGKSKRADARADIDAIVERKKKILDSTGTDTSIPGAGSGGFSAWPNSSTASTDSTEGGGERLFRIGDRTY